MKAPFYKLIMDMGKYTVTFEIERIEKSNVSSDITNLPKNIPIKEKHIIENIAINTVEATRNKSLFVFFDNLKNNQPNKLPTVPVVIKKANNNNIPLIKTKNIKKIEGVV